MLGQRTFSHHYLIIYNVSYYSVYTSLVLRKSLLIRQLSYAQQVMVKKKRLGAQRHLRYIVLRENSEHTEKGLDAPRATASNLNAKRSELV